MVLYALCMPPSNQSPVPPYPETLDPLPHTNQSLSLSNRSRRATSSPRPLAQIFHPTRSPSPSSAITSSSSLRWSSEIECEPIFPPPSSLYILSRTHVTSRVHSSVVTPTRLATQVGAPKHGSAKQVSQDGSSRQALSSSAQVRQPSLSCPLAQ